MASCVRRVAVDEIAIRRRRDCVGEVLARESVFARAHDVRDRLNLVGDFGDVRLGESVGLAAEWDVEFAFAVETDKPVERRAVQKQKVERVAARVEAVADFVVSRAVRAQQRRAFSLKKAARGRGSDFALRDGFVESDDMRVGIRQQRALRAQTERHDARPHERLYPNPAEVGGNGLAYPRNELGLDALALDGRDDCFGCGHY